MKVLSVVIATYKREAYLITCLRNIVDSLIDDCSINSIEIIIINNDPSVDIEKLIITSGVLQNVSFSAVNNNSNLGMDSSQLNGILIASGKYVMLGSDRYSYNIDFKSVIKYLISNEPDVLLFSDLLRRFYVSPKNLIMSYKDEWILSEFPNIIFDDISFTINNENSHFKRLVHKGLIHKFSDAIFKKNDARYYLKFKDFDGTFMLGIAVLLDSIIKSFEVKILRVNYNTVSVLSVGDAITHIRHDYNKVVQGNIMIQERNSDFFSLSHVNINQFSALLGLKRGVLSGEIVMDVGIDKKTVFHLFLKTFKDTSLVQKISFIFLFVLESKIFAKSFNLVHRVYKSY